MDALAEAHKVTVRQSSRAKIDRQTVLGDSRAANCMVRCAILQLDRQLAGGSLL